MNLRTTLPALTAVLVLTAGCSTEAVEPPGPTAAPTTSTPTPTPSPTPDPDGILEQSDPALGIVLADPPTLTGAEADVYDTMALYAKAYWSTMTSNEAHPSLDVLASPELKSMMEQIAATNTGIGADIGGSFRVQISQVTVTGTGEATASTCSDYGEVTFVDAEGRYTPDEAGMGEPARNVYTLRDVGGVWQVATSEYTGPC